MDKKRDPVDEQAVREAAQRLLTGQPRTAVAGRLSAVELAEEAGISRGRLYREFGDLKDDFLAGVARLHAGPPPETPRESALLERVNALESEVRDLKARLTAGSLEIAQRKNANDQFMRIINLLERQKQKLEGDVENARLRQARDRQTVESLRDQIRSMGDPDKPEGAIRVVGRGGTEEDP